MPTVHIDSFSVGLEELKRKDAANPAVVLRILDRVGRFSVFEATDNKTIAQTMDHIFSAGLVENTGKGEFPWTYVRLTDKGRELLARAA